MNQILKNKYIVFIFLVFIILNSGTIFIASHASMTSIRSISSHGSIIYTHSARPLHVEGKIIKDDLGNIIYLRGSTHYGFEQQPSGGHWYGEFLLTYEDWNEHKTGVEAELDMMKSWGINVVRFPQAIDLWKYDIEDHRQIIKELLTEMAERDMYMIYCPFLIASRGTGDFRGSLPYPPYAQVSSIMESESDFVDYWTSVASELKDYPNVIFELWNEPSFGSVDESQRMVAFNSWSDTTQQCIDAVRATGARQLILVQWMAGCHINLDNPPPEDPTPNPDLLVPPPLGQQTVDWAWNISANDPLGNIVYSTHMYRRWGAFYRQVGGKENRIQLWEHDDVVTCLELMKLKKLAQIHPVIIGEIGCDIDLVLDPSWGRTDPDLQHELSAFDSALSVFNGWGLHWCSWWWHGDTHNREHSGYPDYTPNEAGEIVIARLNQ